MCCYNTFLVKALVVAVDKSGKHTNDACVESSGIGKISSIDAYNFNAFTLVYWKFVDTINSLTNAGQFILWC